MKSQLFVIRQRHSEQYWTCSNEHGCGWSDRFPKQSFSKSELSREIFNMIDRGYFSDVVIIQLDLSMDGENPVVPAPNRHVHAIDLEEKLEAQQRYIDRVLKVKESL